MHSLSLQTPAPSPSPAVRHYVAKRRGVNSALGTPFLPLAPVYPIRTNNGCDSSRDKVTFTNPPHPAPSARSPHPPQFRYNQHPCVPTPMPASSNTFCYDDRYIILFVCFGIGPGSWGLARVAPSPTEDKLLVNREMLALRENATIFLAVVTRDSWQCHLVSV